MTEKEWKNESNVLSWNTNHVPFGSCYGLVYYCMDYVRKRCVIWLSVGYPLTQFKHTHIDNKRYYQGHSLFFLKWKNCFWDTDVGPWPSSKLTATLKLMGWTLETFLDHRQCRTVNWWLYNRNLIWSTFANDVTLSSIFHCFFSLQYTATEVLRYNVFLVISIYNFSQEITVCLF